MLIFCHQETKMQENQKFDFEGYYEYWNSAEKKGYSEPLSILKKNRLMSSMVLMANCIMMKVELLP